jgi:hypothetical protein
MRGAAHFVAIVVISLALVVGVAFLMGASMLAAGLGCFVGIAVTIGASIYVNTRNANRYGRQVWDECQHLDFDEPAIGSRRARVRRGRGRGVHETPFSGSEASVRDE